MRKIAAILLSCCLCFTLLGYHILYKIRLSAIKAEMKTRLQSHSSDEVTTLIFNQQDRNGLEWEEGKEIRYGNEMYDVIDTATVNDQLIVRCIHDKKERELIENYQKIHDGSPSPIQTRLVKLMNTYFIPASICHFSNPYGYCLNQPPLYTDSFTIHIPPTPDRPPCTV